MNHERWKSAWGQVRGTASTYWDRLNEQSGNRLEKAQSSVSRQLRTLFGSKDSEDAASSAPTAASEAQPVRDQDVSSIHEHRPNGRGP